MFSDVLCLLMKKLVMSLKLNPSLYLFANIWFFVVFGFKKNHIHKNSPQSLMNELQCGKSKRHLEVFLVISVEVVLSLNL